MEDAPRQSAPWNLSAVRVRLIEPGERPRWEALMRAHHYLGLGAMVGKSLRYVGEVHGDWVGLLGWASAALKCAPRDAWIGWACVCVTVNPEEIIERYPKVRFLITA